MLGAIHHSVNKPQAGSEVNFSLQALLADMIEHKLLLLWFFFFFFFLFFCFFQRFLAVILEFGVVPVFPFTYQGEHCIYSLTLTFTQGMAAQYRSGGFCVVQFSVVWSSSARHFFQDFPLRFC